MKYIALELSRIYKGHLYLQNFILVYSPDLYDSIAHGFILNGEVFIELYAIYIVPTPVTIRDHNTCVDKLV